jgi:hypothetical protein
MAVRISVFTGRLRDPQRVSRVKDASVVAAEHRAEMLVLLGYSLGRDLAEDALRPRALLAGEHGLSPGSR